MPVNPSSARQCWQCKAGRKINGTACQSAGEGEYADALVRFESKKAGARRAIFHLQKPGRNAKFILCNEPPGQVANRMTYNRFGMNNNVAVRVA